MTIWRPRTSSVVTTDPDSADPRVFGEDPADTTPSLPPSGLRVIDQPDTLSATAIVSIPATLTLADQSDTITAIGSVTIPAELDLTDDDDTIAATADYVPWPVTIDVADFSQLPLDFELGTAGSNMRGKFITIGTTDYIWWSHAADTPAGVVQTGYDPIVFESALAGMTGHEIQLPQGRTTPEDHADLLAAAFLTVASVTGATARPSANADGSWTVDVDCPETISWGTRAWGSRGAAGLDGGHMYRTPETGEATGWLNIAITRPIASRKNALATGARVWAAQLDLADTVGTGATQRPRLQYRWSNSDTTPAGSETFDFGQIPTSQIVAGAASTIFLTPAQVAAFETARAGATGTRHWIQAHAVSGTEYVGAATSTGYGGEQINANIRVETVGSNDPGSALATWSSSGELNFAFVLGARVCYEVNPCTTLEHRTRLGSVASYATYPTNVTLPDSVTGQRAPVTGLEGRRILSIQSGVVSGTARMGVHTGGNHSEDTPSMVGATALVDLGTNAANGDINYPAPTGASTVRIPTSGGIWWLFKGNGAQGRGQLGPGPFANTGRPDQPVSWIRRFDTAGNRALNRGEVDIDRTAGGYGNAATAFESPITDPDTQEFLPGNNPYGYLEIGTPAIPIAA